MTPVARRPTSQIWNGHSLDQSQSHPVQQLCDDAGFPQPRAQSKAAREVLSHFTADAATSSSIGVLLARESVTLTT
jgi:hypothetical protein